MRNWVEGGHKKGGDWVKLENSMLLFLPVVLQLFCSSPKAALRYAAVRTLNKVRDFKADARDLHFFSVKLYALEMILGIGNYNCGAQAT